MTNTVRCSLREAPPGPQLVSIGTFDGVHLGHQHLLSLASARANQIGLPLLVVTFEPNPAQVIRPELFRGRLNTPHQKLERLWTTGASEVVVVPFTVELMRETPEMFVAQLIEATHPVEVWVGEEFALGHNRSGDVKRLTALGARMGFELNAVPRWEHHGQIVSSSGIRQHILEGEATIARTLLGYPFRISGEVIHGAQVGRTIGFPTANVEPPTLLAPLPDGIYASLATLEGANRQSMKAMTYIGTRPALNTGARQIETNILDFSMDIYGQTLHCDFVQRLRSDATFTSVEELIGQLERDEIAAREVLDRHTR